MVVLRAVVRVSQRGCDLAEVWVRDSLSAKQVAMDRICSKAGSSKSWGPVPRDHVVWEVMTLKESTALVSDSREQAQVPGKAWEARVPGEGALSPPLRCALQGNYQIGSLCWKISYLPREDLMGPRYLKWFLLSYYLNMYKHKTSHKLLVALYNHKTRTTWSIKYEINSNHITLCNILSFVWNPVTSYNENTVQPLWLWACGAKKIDLLNQQEKGR